ncbi:general secretion pathway protein GspF [Aminobacter sp. Y103A]|uniref:type II secretion system F family protein n=1 Tax=Aminobacter sp. Y103A TaxID=1870862 RepID=UPI00257239C2|nr:type II secretion system F family protein [Aminobacter sp. SS-2016]BBD40257.1 general secretion pathway protein GspF [Aminobacter sp. SS-2016]
MPTFRYRAYLADGTDESGLLEAATKQDAARDLSKRGCRPYYLAPTKTDQSAARPSSFALFSQKVKPERLFADLSVLLNAGFTIDRALAAVIASEGNRARQGHLQSIHDLIVSGRSVAEAFATLPAMSPTTIALLSSGEKSGKIALVCQKLAESYQASARRKTAIIEALTYPAFLLIVMVGALFVLAAVLVPALEPIFEGSTSDKPLVMSMLASLRNTFIDYPAVFPLIVLICLLAFFGMSRSTRMQNLASEALLKTPLLGQLIKRMAVARYLQTLSLLLANGVTMLDALKLAGDTVAQAGLRPHFADIKESVANGSKLNDAIAGQPLFEQATVSLISIGEEANALPAVLERAAEMLQMRVTSQIEALLKLLTPIMTISMGLVVGSLVVSVMTTILSINDLALK